MLVSITGAERGGNVLAKLAGIRCIHDTPLRVALAPVVCLPINPRPLLLAVAPVEARAVVISTHDELDFALQAGVPRGTDAEHAVLVLGLFEGELLRLSGLDAGVGAKLPVAVAARPAVVAVEVAVPVVGGHDGCWAQKEEMRGGRPDQEAQ